MKTIIKNAHIVNEGIITEGDLLINHSRIEKIAPQIDVPHANEINAEGQYLIPGVIDDQVHFREPGLTHKANIFTESKAAVAGGTTTFMEMPNTKPSATTQQLLEDKYQIASKNAWANYSFFMGAANDNYEEVMRTDIKNVCGIKIFMGSSTGHMLVDDSSILEKLFANVPCLIATHCEDENRIKERMEKYGQEKPHATLHPIIRDEEACYLSSSKAVEMAQKHTTRLHILHISTAKELSLFNNTTPLKNKKITSEVCVHHLSLNDTSYDTLGNQMKCNPAIKSANDQTKLWEGLLNDTLDIVATDHAPHTKEEKEKSYFEAPSGLPLVQHSLLLMLQHSTEGKISLEKIVEKMCHAPAVCFQIKERGFIREGYFADLVLLKKDTSYQINKQNILYKCAWSPFTGKVFDNIIMRTIVNGNTVYHHQNITAEEPNGLRLEFDR